MWEKIIVRRSAVAACALGIVVLLDVLRVWLPSIIFVYGRAGTTPATEMGLFAAGPFLLAFAAVAAVRILAPRRVMIGAAGVLAAARVVLQLTEGGDLQLWVATAAVAAGLWWLVAAAASWSGSAAGLGMAAGLAADGTFHVLLRSTGLAWRDGVVPLLVVLVLCAAFMTTVLRERESGGGGGGALGWVALGGGLVVHGVVSGVVSRAAAVTAWPEWLAALLTVGGLLAGVLLACVLVTARSTRLHRGVRLAAAVLVVGGLAAALSARPALMGMGHLLLPAGVGAAVAAALATGSRSAPLRALAAAGGLLLFVILAFGYYAAYDLVLPFGNDVLVMVAAGPLLVALLAARVRAHRIVSSARSASTGRGMGALAGLLLVVVGAVGLMAQAPSAQPGEGFPLTVFNYNLQMGFDIDGRHAVARQAQLLVDQRPDVVTLQEVSRGWLINASTDVLAPIAEALDMPYVFAPAADRVWGNAIAARHPILESGHQPLPRLESAMQRSVLWAVLDLGPHGELAVVTTHLQHVAGQVDVRRAQAEVVAGVVRRHVGAGRPVLLMGDMNAEPGAAELAAFEGLVEEVSAVDGPIATWPSWGPETHIDHIYVTPDLAASAVVVPQSTASDHLGLGATVRRKAAP